MRAKNNVIKIAPWVSYQKFEEDILIGVHKPHSYNKYYLLKNDASWLWEKIVSLNGESVHVLKESILKSNKKLDAKKVSEDIDRFIEYLRIKSILL